MPDRAAVRLRFALCLLSLDGDEARQRGQTGKARRDANRHCCGRPAKDTHPGEPSKHSCNYTLRLAPTLLHRVINLKKRVFSSFFHILSFFSVQAETKFHSASFCWNLPVVYNLLGIFVFSVAPCASIFPSAAPHHLFSLPFSVHLFFFPYSHPLLSPHH